MRCGDGANTQRLLWRPPLIAVVGDVGMKYFFNQLKFVSRSGVFLVLLCRPPRWMGAGFYVVRPKLDDVGGPPGGFAVAIARKIRELQLQVPPPPPPRRRWW